jgi:hypothetical protein
MLKLPLIVRNKKIFFKNIIDQKAAFRWESYEVPVRGAHYCRIMCVLSPAYNHLSLSLQYFRIILSGYASL